MNSLPNRRKFEAAPKKHQGLQIRFTFDRGMVGEMDRHKDDRGVSMNALVNQIIQDWLEVNRGKIEST